MTQMSLRVAIVCPQPELRMTAVKAFDSAPLDWDLRLVSEPTADADVIVSVGAEMPGAVSMDTARPEGVVEEILRSCSAPELLTVVGASGGCGATSVALHLAAAFARTERVNLVDMHPDLDAAFRLGLQLDELDLGEEPVLLPVAGGFRMVASREPCVDISLRLARTSADKVVVDAPPEVLGELEPTGRVVCVMTPTLPSVHKAARLMARHPGLAWLPVTNRTGPGSELTPVDIERILGRRLTLELPCSPGLRDAEDELGLLSARFSPWRIGVQRLAAAL